tara:strand:+ start:3 stop:1145 length:1143 start_codon:yes stop_codon:yes gene_type:complete
MNRTLRRPMFRMGGSTEGITSGLDMPKTNASRQNFKNGNSAEYKSPLGLKFTEMDLSRFKNQNNNDMESRYKRAMDFIESKRTPRTNDLNDFLISMGLDLVSRPTSGNIFADVATSAKGPFAQMQAAKASRAADQDKLSQALVGDIMEQMSKEDIARIKAKSEAGKGTKQFEYKGKYEDYQALLKTQRTLEDQKTKLEEQKTIAEKESLDPANEFAIPTDTTAIDLKIEQINKQIEDNAKLQALFIDKEEDQVRSAILKGIANGVFTFDDLVVYDETGVPPRDENADGGRIGYQQGNMVQPNTMQATMPTDQGPTQDSAVQDLTYEELRSRLPESITNDIVQLIANSQQALVEFANIQTQQDVKEFNRKYEVNLVLPQEA